MASRRGYRETEAERYEREMERERISNIPAEELRKRGETPAEHAARLKEREQKKDLARRINLVLDSRRILKSHV